MESSPSQTMSNVGMCGHSSVPRLDRSQIGPNRWNCDHKAHIMKVIAPDAWATRVHISTMFWTPKSLVWLGIPAKEGYGREWDVGLHKSMSVPFILDRCCTFFNSEEAMCATWCTPITRNAIVTCGCGCFTRFGPEIRFAMAPTMTNSCGNAAEMSARECNLCSFFLVEPLI